MGKKGGDIDLLVVSKKIGYRERRRIRVELLKRLGDRKIDLLVVGDPKETVFSKIAYKSVEWLKVSIERCKSLDPKVEWNLEGCPELGS